MHWSNGTDTITLEDILYLTQDVEQIELPIDDNLKSKLLHWNGSSEEMVWFFWIFCFAEVDKE